MLAKTAKAKGSYFQLFNSVTRFDFCVSFVSPPVFTSKQNEKASTANRTKHVFGFIIALES